MSDIFQESLFSVGEETYGFADVLLFAAYRGDWPALVDELRRGLAAVQHADTTGQAPAPEQIDAAVNRLRRDRGLRTAESMRVWLEARGLSAGDWLEYVRRAVVRDRHRDELPDLAARYPPADDDVRRAIRAEAFCSGEVARWAIDLAASAAVHAVRAEQGRHDDPALPAPVELAMQAAAFLPVRFDWAAERLPHLAHLDACFDAYCARALTPEAVAQFVESERLLPGATAAGIREHARERMTQAIIERQLSERVRWLRQP